MGTLYFGPYHDRIDSYEHEGYAVRVMPDGAETTTFGGQWGWDGHVGYRARCVCGWSGKTLYPVPDPDPMDCDDAIDEWHFAHIVPLVKEAQEALRDQAWPEWSRYNAATASEYLTSGRHREAVIVLEAMGEDLATRLRSAKELAGTSHRGWGGR